MNERIKELAKEAALVYKIIPPPATHTTPLYLIDNFKENSGPSGIQIISDGFCEKFAELIVRECMACSTWVGRVNKYAIEPEHTAHTINQCIKEHFGVEE